MVGRRGNNGRLPDLVEIPESMDGGDQERAAGENKTTLNLYRGGGGR
jgi:hypothetical protein